MRPSVAGTAKPKITMIGPTSASAPMEATCRSEKAMMPAVARRASTPRRARARTCAAVPAAPPKGAAVATALPTSWVEAMSGSGVRLPEPPSIRRRWSTQVRYSTAAWATSRASSQYQSISTSWSDAARTPSTDGARRYTTPPPRIHGSPRRAKRPNVGASIDRMGAGSLARGAV